MQVKNFCSKNSLELTDVIEVLSAKFNKSVWSSSSQLKESHIALLNLTFGTQPQNQLPQAKEQLPLPQQNVTIDHFHFHSENENSLTIPDVQELQTQTQISEIEETAVHHAIEAFQVYQDTYEDVTRALILKDVHQRTQARNQRRIDFELKQQQRQEAQIKQETSHDAKTELLKVLKADDYKNTVLVNILGGL